MNTHYIRLILGLILGLIFYFLASLISAIFLHPDLSLLQVLFTDPPPGEMLARLLGAAVLMLITLFAPLISRRTEPQATVTGGQTRLSSDPSLMVNVANHIRTPLNAIMGFVELLRDPGISNLSRNLYLSHIRTSGRYLTELINNISDITKIETGELYLNPSKCKINHLLLDFHKQYSELLKEKEKNDVAILLKTGIKNDEFQIVTDEKRLKQILSNLLENAIGFTDEGIIEFGYKFRDEQTMEFYVKDTGTGISHERLELVLNHYNKVVDNRMRPFDIVSLRISMAKHLIRLMGGDIEAESRLGQGSDFHFTLKVQTPEVQEPRKEPVHETKPMEPKKDSSWKEKQILIAEDVESNFIYLQEILRPTGAKIKWAENGKEAVEICQKQPDIDLVLMDILMPELDGYEAAKEIKSFHPDLPIIAQTAYHLDEGEYKDAKDYFDKFLIKPIWSFDLMNTLKQYFDPLN